MCNCEKIKNIKFLISKYEGKIKELEIEKDCFGETVVINLAIVNSRKKIDSLKKLLNETEECVDCENKQAELVEARKIADKTKEYNNLVQTVKENVTSILSLFNAVKTIVEKQNATAEEILAIKEEYNI